MGTSVSLEWKAEDIARLTGGKLDRAVLRATKNAGDKAFRWLVREAAGHIKKRKNLKSAFIRGGMKTRRPGKSAALADLTWRLWVSGESVALSKYPYKATAKGVRVRVNKGSGGKLIRSAFVRRVGSGHVGIFMRKERYPIKHLYSSTLRQTLQDEGVIDRLYESAYETMENAFNKGLAYQLAKLGVGGTEFGAIREG